MSSGKSVFSSTTRIIAAAIAFIMVATATVVAPFAGVAEAQGSNRALITEFVASNSTSLLDEDGDSSDWIELWNPSGDDLDLAEWTLTDDASQPAKWTFPSTVIPAGEYLVVFASDKERAVPGGELHTNFKLSAGGEYLGLFDETGALSFEYAPTYPEQVEDISYGHLAGTLGYFAEPTPGAPNSAQSPGFVEPVTIDLAHGFYSSAQTVTLSTPTPGVLIRYTLDGTEPTTDNGLTYSGPLVIGETTTLRASAVMPGFLPGVTSTATYLFADDVITQPATAPVGFPNGPVNGQVYNYGMDPEIVSGNEAAIIDALTAIPSVSIVADPEDLFGAEAGIYSNALEDGREWERPASVELIDPTGAEAGFEIAAGLRIRGGFSRNDANPKHAFRVFFRDEYGGDLDYSLFGTEGPDSFERIDFRTAQNYSWSFQGNRDDRGSRNTFLRDVFSRDTHADLGNASTRSSYYHLYLNGQYWGLYQSQERLSEEYAETYFGGDKDDYDVVKHDRDLDYRTVATDGTDAAWRALWPIVADQQITDDEFTQLEGLVDFQSLIDAQLIYGYTAEIDGAPSRFLQDQRGNNWYAIRNRNGVGEAGKWLFFVHDTEHSLGARNHDPLLDRTGPYPVGAENTIYGVEYMHPGWIHQALMSNDAYVELFEARANQVLRGDGALTPAQVQARWDAREAEVAPLVVAESARWGDARSATPYTTSDWATEVAWVESNWFPTRTDTLIAQLDLPDPGANAAPTIDITPTETEFTVGAELSLQFAATDPEGAALVWSAEGLPAGLTIDSDSGLIEGSIRESGDAVVTVTVTDPFGATGSVTLAWSAIYPATSRMILNEWNAVDSDAFLKDGGADSTLGTVLGNGGDWFELVTIEDNLDIRGWSLEISDENDLGEQEVSDVFVFGDDPRLASLRAGTIITVSEDLADDVSYDPAGGDWHINLQANSDDEGAFFTADSQSNFGVSNDDWQLAIRDAAGNPVFGPAGEGISTGGVGSDEIGELEADPSASITPLAAYDDGADSTFGAPNGFDDRLQDFTAIRPTFDTSLSLIAQTGQVSTDQADANTWHAVTFDQAMVDPVIAMTVATFNGGQPVHPRLRNITTSGFEFQLEEWAYLDGFHITETLNWIAVERGEHTLADGAVIQAGSSDVTHVASTVSFTQAFDQPPVVIGQIASENGGDPFVDRIFGVEPSGFSVRPQEEEARRSTAHVVERFDWIAFESGVHESFGTGSAVTGRATATASLPGGFDGVLLSDMQTRNGGDTASVRVTNSAATSATVFVQEEQSRDSELNHFPETIGLVQTNAQLFAIS